MNSVLNWIGISKAKEKGFSASASKGATFDVVIDGEGFLVDLARVFRVLVYVWLALFLLSRYHMYTHALAHAANDVDDANYMAKKCLEDERHRRIESKSCAEHIANRDKSLHDAAIQYVIDNTYLCGYDTCSNVVGSLFVQIGLAAVAAVGAGFAIYALFVRFCADRQRSSSSIAYGEETGDYENDTVDTGRRRLQELDTVRQRRIALPDV